MSEATFKTSNEQSVQRFSGWGIAMLQNKPITEYVLASDYDALAAQLRIAPSNLLVRAVELLQLGASSDERGRLRKDIEAFLRSPPETSAEPVVPVPELIWNSCGPGNGGLWDCPDSINCASYCSPPWTFEKATEEHQRRHREWVADEATKRAQKSEPPLTISKPPQNITASASTATTTAPPSRQPPSSAVECPKCEDKS